MAVISQSDCVNEHQSLKLSLVSEKAYLINVSSSINYTGLLPVFQDFGGGRRHAVDGPVGVSVSVADGDGEAAKVAADDLNALTTVGAGTVLAAHGHVLALTLVVRLVAGSVGRRAWKLRRNKRVNLIFFNCGVHENTAGLRDQSKDSYLKNCCRKLIVYVPTNASVMGKGSPSKEIMMEINTFGGGDSLEDRGGGGRFCAGLTLKAITKTEATLIGLRN